MADLKFERLTGRSLTDALTVLADLRVQVFREWPYLYSGDAEYEADYVARYGASRDAMIVACIDPDADDKIVGAASGQPLAREMDAFIAPFEKAGYDIGAVFYFGESVLLPAYRGRGAGHAFFDHREAHARALGGFTTCAFCGVVRDTDDPRAPADYRPLDPFWQKRGYQKAKGLVTSFPWQEIGSDRQTDHPMQFWVRGLEYDQ